ncbi:elongation of very long chain fatty acids protein 5-like [Tigriopus californicus]|uniref:elongation of very long chain fatty acids protein 5-like n=1 Tax=Tigriopus californicus TaxID=6832 RepID=UPI0027DA5FAC|nr:elongation of very long chain fatty acids protein 5-like [Tigriopus californicus]
MELLQDIPMHRYREIGWSFLTSTSFPIFCVYLLMVNQLGTIKRAIPIPYDLRQLMGVYNLVISVVNVYCFVGFMQCLLEAPSLYEKTPNAKLSFIFYVYWITKVCELLDTVFMILRHRFRQISPLHVYHHASMLLLSDLGYTRYAWAAFAMPLMLNALVHVFLYLYYGLTAMGWQPSWKRRLTELQIVQFVIDLVHASIGVLYHNFCYWSLGYGLSMLYLFTAFYIRTYLRAGENQKRQ